MLIQTKSWSPVGHACQRARAAGLPKKSPKIVHQPRISSPRPTLIAAGQNHSAGLNVPSGGASIGCLCLSITDSNNDMDHQNVDRGTRQYVIPNNNSPQYAQPRQSGALTSTARRPKTWACLSCQTRKIRCDGIKPFCSTCLAHKRQCQYEVRASGSKRYEKSL